MSHPRASSFVLALSLVSLASASARADDPRARASIGLGHAVGGPQDRELGFGVVGDVGVDVPIADFVGISGRVGGVALADGSPPRDPRIADRPGGLAAVLFGGARFGQRDKGPWGDFGVGLVATGVARFGFDLRAGWDLPIDRRGWLFAGPLVGYLHVLQPNDTLRPEDAHIVFAGANIVYGKRSGPCVDSDRDGVCDDADACVDKPGPTSSDPKKTGCPPEDRDRDTVFDDDDACPDTPGERTSDPTTNGCPKTRDRDGDGIPDGEDACPDQAGERTNDPKTNGCPANKPDRDNDGIPDDEDACPDIPGVRTEDRNTNGCPPAAGPVRVEGDRLILDDVILFDLNSPRVRNVSWALVEKVAKFIIATPDILELDIEGHADRTGSDAHNLRLSRERAQAVKNLLVKYGVGAKRVNVRGYGESRPRTQARGAAQAADRRVEFWVVKARPAKSGAKP